MIGTGSRRRRINCGWNVLYERIYFQLKKLPRWLLSLPLYTGIPALISFHINSKANHRDINNFRKKLSILSTLCTLLMTWGAYKKSRDPSMTAHAGNCSTQGSLQGYWRRLSVKKSHVSLEHKMIQLLFENFIQAYSILRSNWQHSLSFNSSSTPQNHSFFHTSCVIP